jgi:hypothetical protein
MYDMIDDDDNYFCPNNHCNKYTNCSIFNKKENKIGYCCLDCGRTLLQSEMPFVKNGDIILDWYYNRISCNHCYNNCLKLKCTIECIQCGNIKVKDSECICEINKKINKFIQSNNCSQDDINYKKSNEKCKYCAFTLQKCQSCDEPCYICIICKKSNINGNEVEYSSYMCISHSQILKNCWIRNKLSFSSNEKCDNCGLQKNVYKDIKCCHNMEKYDLHFCISCCWEDKIMSSIYCYECY